MYYYIKGKLARKGESFVVVDVGGVGYLINTSRTSIDALGAEGGEATLYTRLNVREDALDIYGFTTTEEKEMFLKLTAVTGVGPKAALAVLSVTTPASLALAVITEDVKTITKAPGVGKKLAQRVILELKDKLKNEDIALPKESEATAFEQLGELEEAVSALVVLGYSANEARRAISGLDADMGVEQLIKQALTKLF